MRKYVTLPLIEREVAYLQTASSLLHGGSSLCSKELAAKIDFLIDVTSGAVEITNDRNDLLKRIKRLEDAGDAMAVTASAYVADSACSHPGERAEFEISLHAWTAAKESKP